MSYGGADDWSALAITDTVASAGRIEAASHKHLEAFKTAGESNRAGENRITYELYRCTFDQAKSALERSAPKGTKIVSKASPLVQNAFNH